MLSAADIAAALDAKAKPPGALGRLETLAAQIAALQQSLSPRMATCTLTIFAADHGIAAEGVSAYPQAVTRAMLRCFLDGGAAANAVAAAVGVAVRVVDAGVAGPPLGDPAPIDRRIGAGTRNSAVEPAMTPADCAAALAHGAALGAGSPGEAACFGEMGIGNTAAATLVAHKLTGLDLDVLTGRGTGLDDAGLARKRAVLARAAARTAPRLDAGVALAEYGGFEIAMLSGAIRGAAAARKLVIVDGFIAGAAALAAVRAEPACADALVFAHRSAEHGHAAMLEALDAVPLLDLGLRLGEGTGALLAWPLVRAAAALFGMATLAEVAG